MSKFLAPHNDDTIDFDSLSPDEQAAFIEETESLDDELVYGIDSILDDPDALEMMVSFHEAYYERYLATTEWFYQ